jgi:TolB-like protein
VKRAIAFIRSNKERKISTADIVKAAGTSERILRKNFVRFLGVPPMAYLRRVRLAMAREQLINGNGDTSVTDVATRMGFMHVSRFASDYQRQFKELPSVTLAKSRSISTDLELEQRQALDKNAGSDLASPYFWRALPTLSIYPFQCPSSDYDVNACAAGLVDQLAATLSRIRAVTVKLCAAPRGHPAAERQATHYALLGRITREGERVRVIVRLVDLQDQRHVWGDSYDGVVHLLFVLSDRVVDGVVHALQPVILAEDIRRAFRKPPAVLLSRDLTLRWLPTALSWNRSAQALEPLHEAIELDPEAALPVALAAWCYTCKRPPWTAEGRRERAFAKVLAERAGLLDADDPLVLALRATVAQSFKDFEYADALSVRAVARDPGQVLGWERRAWLREANGRCEEAIPLFERSDRIEAPFLDGAESLVGIGSAHYSCGRFHQATQWLREAWRIRPGSKDVNAKLAVCYLRSGDRRAALKALEVVRHALPDVTVAQFIDAYNCREPRFREFTSNGLSDLGMPP